MLTSLAEALAERDGRAAAACLLEAVELFRRCLETQEAARAQAQTSGDSAVDEEEGGGIEVRRPAGDADVNAETEADADEDQRRQESQWFSVIEPVTDSAVVETLVAMLGALAALCNIGPTERGLTTEQLEQAATPLIQLKIPQYATPAAEEDQAEAWQAGAEFMAALLDAKFREGVIDVRSYDGLLKGVFDDAAPGYTQVRRAFFAAPCGGERKPSTDRPDFESVVRARGSAHRLQPVPIRRCWKLKPALDSSHQGGRAPHKSIEAAACRSSGRYPYSTWRRRVAPTGTMPVRWCVVCTLQPHSQLTH